LAVVDENPASLQQSTGFNRFLGEKFRSVAPLISDFSFCPLVSTFLQNAIAKIQRKFM
jgi:hypothetical protein